MQLMRIYCFIWCFILAYGGCPSLYNVEFSVRNWNPGRDTRIFGTKERRQEIVEGWKMLDESIQQSCATTGFQFPKVVMIWIGNQVDPGYCSVTTICNASACMELGSPSNLFTEELYMPEESVMKIKRHNETVLLNLTHTEIKTRPGSSQPSRTCNKINSPSNMWDYPFDNISSYVNVWKTGAEFTYKKYCEDIRVHDFYFVVDGLLDFFCSRLLVCSNKRCLVYSSTAQKYASIFPFRSPAQKYATIVPFNACYSNIYPNFPICTAVESHIPPRGRRIRRRPLITYSGLFNLPFTKYCGPGTDVMFEDDTGGPTGFIDEACRQHDIAYMLGEDPAEADAEHLRNVWDSPYYYAFWLAINTKQAFESVTGKEYTSELYVTPSATAATFAHYFYFKSVFDGFEANNTQIDIIKEKELAWKMAVLDIWRGQCYVQKRPGSDTETPLGKPTDITPSMSQLSPTDSRIDRHVVIAGDENLVTVASEYPPPPPAMAPCRVVINEIKTDNGLTKHSFIELMKVCPEGVHRDRAISLKDFYLAVLKAADPVELHVLIDLGSQQMVPMTETVDTVGEVQSRNVYYFVVGSTNVKEKNMNLFGGGSTTYGGKNGIPSGSNSVPGETFSVVLLQSDSLKKFASKCKSALPVQLEVEDVESFGNALQDIVTYGEQCNRIKCSVFMKWNLGLLQLNEDDDVLPIPDQTDTKISRSINRCSQNHNPMQQERWETATPTPLRKNECGVRMDPLYIFKNGCSLQSSAQYVIMNVRNFFRVYKLGTMPGLLENNEVELTSKATGISARTVKRIDVRHKSGTIQTPKGRKRKRLSRALCRFTEADKNHIKEFIQNKYKANLPPYFDAIFEDSQQYFQEQNPPRTMCGKSTFRKLLYMMGFHYGRIDTLLVVLERPDIVIKRGVYLRKMKENERSEKPKPVIYTDESWIDPHSRTGKAWVPKGSQWDHKEKLKYNYAKHHTNRGKRIIMIHAAGPNGLIHNSEAVFEVGGKKSGTGDQPIAEDYHDNIESSFYFAWFRNLCINIKNEYGDAIIVIDNAPYHTKSDAPTSKSLKKELLDYLLKIDVDGLLTRFDKNKKYLRWQLWEMVLNYKKESTDHYIIDRLAKEYGHTVIRLPPHQCNFNPIEMLWSSAKGYVRSHNIDQTIETVKRIVKEFFILYQPEDWRTLVEHTDRLREQYWRTDELYDEFLDAHEKMINEDPSSVNEEAVDSSGTEYGPLDSYMHAGTEIVFDENSDIVLGMDDTGRDT